MRFLFLFVLSSTRNSSGDKTANVNFLYDDIVHVLQNTIDSCINSGGGLCNGYIARWLWSTQLIRRARLVRRWPTVSRFNSRCRTFISRSPATQGQLSRPSSRVGKWVPASAGKAKAGMVHSVSGCPRRVQLKLWDPLRTCAISERLRCVHDEALYKFTFTVYLHIDAVICWNACLSNSWNNAM